MTTLYLRPIPFPSTQQVDDIAFVLKKGWVARSMLTTFDLWKDRGRRHDLWFGFFEKVQHFTPAFDLYASVDAHLWFDRSGSARQMISVNRGRETSTGYKHCNPVQRFFAIPYRTVHCTLSLICLYWTDSVLIKFCRHFGPLLTEVSSVLCLCASSPWMHRFFLRIWRRFCVPYKQPWIHRILHILSAYSLNTKKERRIRRKKFSLSPFPGTLKGQIEWGVIGWTV